MSNVTVTMPIKEYSELIEYKKLFDAKIDGAKASFYDNLIRLLSYGHSFPRSYEQAVCDINNYIR